MKKQLLTALMLVALGRAVCAKADMTAQSYQLTRRDIALEISAPREDIVRIRAQPHSLSEEGSWAVLPDARSAQVPLEISQHGQTVVLRTKALLVKVDTDTLHLMIQDALGRVVLEDAMGPSLVFDSLTADGRQGVHLRKHMPPDAHYFGLGDKAGPLDRRGEAFTLWNTDAGGFGESTDPLYKSIPFFLGVRESGGSFGVFFDNSWRSYFDFGRTERNVLAFGAEGGAVDYYVMAGEQPKDIVRAYAFLTGTASLAPMWALGFQQSRYSYASAQEVRAVATRLRRDQIPADALYLDIDYQDRNRPFTVSQPSFPDLPGLIARLRDQHFRVVMITDLHIAAAPAEGYTPYDSGVQQDVFLKNPDGSTYVARVWPGAAVFPDFSRRVVRDWWGNLYEPFVRAGAAGFWNDMNEPAIFDVRDKTMPLDVVHRIDEPGFAPRTASHAELHNVYGMLNSKATFQGLQRLRPHERPFVLTRASFAGGQRYAATWTGDNTSSWNHLRLSVSMLNNLGVSGFGYVGDDIGGFEGNGPPADLLTRWIQIGAFGPIFRDHATKGKVDQEPWVGGRAHEDIRRRYIEARYRLMPYLYSLAEENSRTGVPLMRPVYLEYPQVLSAPGLLGGTADQFMLGPSLLIAPAPIGESPYPYTIRLPGTGWFDYWSGALIANQSVSVTPTIARLPVFVRPGSILPRQPLVQSTQERPRGPLELAIYPGPDCRGTLYLDDGISTDYQIGKYLRQQLRCISTPQRTSLMFDGREGSYAPWWRSLRVHVYGVPRHPTRITLNGESARGRYDSARRTLQIDVPDQVGAGRIDIYTGPTRAGALREPY